MSDMNRVCMTGRLTRDPEVRYIQSGTAVCDIGLAVGSTWFDKAANQRKEEVSFIDVTAFGRLAEVIGEYGSKGRQVAVEGRLKQETWDDKSTGQKRSKIKVIADSLVLLGRHGDSQEPKKEPEDYADPPSTQGAGDEETPF